MQCYPAVLLTCLVLPRAPAWQVAELIAACVESPELAENKCLEVGGPEGSGRGSEGSGNTFWAALRDEAGSDCLDADNASPSHKERLGSAYATCSHVYLPGLLAGWLTLPTLLLPCCAGGV